MDLYTFIRRPFLSNLFEMKQTVELKIRFNEKNPTKTLMLAHLSRRCNSNEEKDCIFWKTHQLFAQNKWIILSNINLCTKWTKEKKIF